MTDPYQVLGIASSATDDEVKAAYRKLAKKYHPDHNNGSPEAEKKMMQVNDAYAQIMDMRKSQELALMRECGALIVQAHPFREAAYIDHIRLFPRQCDGVEVANATRSDFQNEMAEKYADHYGLLKLAGSDNHRGPNQKKLAGICCDEPITGVADFIEKVKAEKTRIFTTVLD